MKAFDEVYQAVTALYDQRDLDHWYMMHRAGLIHLVSSELDIPEEIVQAMINHCHGSADLDSATMDKIRDDLENGRS